MKTIGLMIVERGRVQRTARRGSFLTVARARERITMYKVATVILHTGPKKNDRVGLNKRPESLYSRKASSTQTEC